LKSNILTVNGILNGYPPAAAKINIEGYESVTGYTETGLLIDGTDDGYTWQDTSINTNNTLFTLSIGGILEVDGITLSGSSVPDDLIIMLHNLHDNPTKKEIENENHNVKYIYSDTTMFDNETEHFTYTRIFQSDKAVVEPVARLVATGGSYENNYNYYYFGTTSEGRFLHGLVPKGTVDRFNGNSGFDVEYNPSDGKFGDVGSQNPSIWGQDNTGTNLTVFPTLSNMQTHYWYDPNGNLNFQFDNPYYVAPPAPPLTKETNIALRATFEDATFYINPDTNISGSLSIDENSFNVNTTEQIQGNSSGYKVDTTDTFRIDNFILDPYTITFWLLSKYTGTWGGQWLTILTHGRFRYNDSWRIYLDGPEGEIGVYTYKPGEWYGTGITYDQIYNKWALISISSSGIITIKCDGVDYDNLLINSTGYNTSGDTMEFGGGSDEGQESTNIYFDDIRVYNVELSSSEMVDVYNEIYGDPPPEPDESFKRLVATGGQWNGSFEYLYFETTPEGNFLYGLVETDSSDRYSPTNYDFEYNPSDGKFYD
jgi:hypothetical protein